MRCFGIPPIAGLNRLPGDQIVDAVMNEELANNGNIRPLVTTLREIDCSKRRTRDLSVVIPADGEVRTSDTPQDWHPVPAAGELGHLSTYRERPRRRAAKRDNKFPAPNADCQATLPWRARQTGKLPTIGVMGAASPQSWRHWVPAFVQRLGELDWSEGRTVAIEYRWAE